ncbi:MAG: G8 domain-containing protein, partial [Flavobacteriales bacterium]
MPALAQTTNDFIQPQLNISAVQSAELQVALEEFNARAENIPTVFEAANLESRQAMINSVNSGHWNESTTWSCSCIPGSTDDVVIQESHMVILDSNTEVNNLSIQEGGVLSLDGTVETTLTIHGDWSSAGFVKAGNMR